MTEKINLVEVPIGDLLPAPYNPRKWTEKAIADITASIKKFGFVDPIIANSAPERHNIVIGGHFRLKVAKDLGYETVPVVYVSVPDEETERELNLRLNKNLGAWDFDALAGFGEDLLKIVGFEEFELENIFDLNIEEDEFDIEKEYEKILEPKSKEGDLYQLGKHRILCGNSEKKENFEKLLNNEKADSIFTDPPYNVGYDYWGFRGTRQEGVVSKKIFNDKKTPEEYQDFLYNVFKNCYDFSKESAPFYCWHATKTEKEARNAIEGAGWHISQTLIWLKNSMVFSPGQDYHRVYEPCYFGWKKGEKHFVERKGTGDYKEFILLDKIDFLDWIDSLYESRDKTTEYKHPTQKPVKLAERAFRKHCPIDGIILEPFGGSGSTLMAAEQMKRKCYLLEIDPKYVDVIIARWEKLTGEKAVKIE